MVGGKIFENVKELLLLFFFLFFFVIIIREKIRFDFEFVSTEFLDFRNCNWRNPVVQMMQRPLFKPRVYYFASNAIVQFEMFFF